MPDASESFRRNFPRNSAADFVGLRAGISLALVVIVVAAMFIGGMDGIGNKIADDQMSYNLKDMYGSLLLSGALGYSLNYAFLLIEKYFVHWAGR